MPNDESPDHAGLRSYAERVLESISWDDSFDEDVNRITQYGISAWTAGRVSQEAEMTTLREQAETQRQMFLGMKAQNDLLRAEVEQLRGFLKIDGEVLTNEVDKNRDAIFDIDRLQKDAFEKDREVSQMAAEAQDVIAQRDRARNTIKAAIAFVEQIMEESGELMNPFGDIVLDDLRREIGPAPAKDGE